MKAFVVIAIYRFPPGAEQPYGAVPWLCQEGRHEKRGALTMAQTLDAANATVPPKGYTWRPREKNDPPAIVGVWIPEDMEETDADRAVTAASDSSVP